jgi:hypothetical protein
VPTTTTNPDFAFPAGAIKVDDWMDTGTPASPFRYFEGTRWLVDRNNRDEDIDLYIAGIQHTDGSVSREIVVHELHADEPMTIEQARQLAQALTELVAEAETVDGYDLSPSHDLEHRAPASARHPSGWRADCCSNHGA